MKELFKKKIAISGATGGIGKELCYYFCEMGADLILMDRNFEKSNALKTKLEIDFPNVCINLITLQLEDIECVKTAVERLKVIEPDYIILNAGAYSIQRHKCDTGYDNVFQINFVSPYYIAREMKDSIKRRNGKIIVVGSIAHNYSKIDVTDIDFSTRKKSSLVYGNAKRYLMFSLFGLFKGEKNLAVTHPGITFTNITAHYPKLIFAVIKHPMKIIFMKPKKAMLSIIGGIYNSCEEFEWIGPAIFDVWGKPKKKILKTCNKEEYQKICEIADSIYKKVKN